MRRGRRRRTRRGGVNLGLARRDDAHVAVAVAVDGREQRRGAGERILDLERLLERAVLEPHLALGREHRDDHDLWCDRDFLLDELVGRRDGDGCGCGCGERRAGEGEGSERLESAEHGDRLDLGVGVSVQAEHRREAEDEGKEKASAASPMRPSAEEN